ncbi:dynamin family protein [Rhodobaculum claviforme]|uniref:GTPase n=1 Tax=Rhodobaculum claviforme TaxID=1549854 RepID=A0A934TI61_9RHOB|nr:dynamin family protein [Rhodobaculum claviforme]MBK5926629.1 GTPase [Rhodobaculum claviforme]
MEQFADRIREYYTDPLVPLAKAFMFRRPPTVGELRRPPQVLLLGNHSSGKSTFVNHLLGAEVQKTGVAPTDDGFTIITHGPHDTDLDGHSVVSNPDLPYEGLRHFGDQLVSHIRLKLRPSDLLHTVTLIDSPGMIDEAKAENGRGFDFPAVVRWFAERADLVMIFFDPDKPGTTGETLQVFRESLVGIDHKLLIVLNKMDQFHNLHDFARAYGALCWNLGKVIPRKDLPMIYNTFVPIAGKPASGLRMDDFEKARHDLIEELHRAPTRRMDNQITQMAAFAERLRLHAYVIDEAARRYRRTRKRTYSVLTLVVLALGGGAAVTGLIVALPALAVAVIAMVAVLELVSFPRARRRQIDSFDEIFEGLHDTELLMRDQAEDLRAMWQEVHPRARDMAHKRGLQTFPAIRPADREVLNTLIEQDIPRLRSELYDVLRDASVGADAADIAPEAPAPDPWRGGGPEVLRAP